MKDMMNTGFPPLTSTAQPDIHRPLSSLIHILALWQTRARSRRHLMMLDDRGLADIGVSRADATQEWRKPRWRG